MSDKFTGKEYLRIRDAHFEHAIRRIKERESLVISRKELETFVLEFKLKRVTIVRGSVANRYVCSKYYKRKVLVFVVDTFYDSVVTFLN